MFNREGARYLTQRFEPRYKPMFLDIYFSNIIQMNIRYPETLIMKICNVDLLLADAAMILIML